ncbi:dihydroorotase [Hathewaya histolytica]|uniref:dihydroorotase n=1 Tax=Hathewaya histolytica TaxID=1498 RepID=UPI003B678A1A
MELLIKNVNMVSAEGNFEGDLYIEDGIIKEVGIGLQRDCEIVKGNGNTLMPSFVDMHCHFRDPGYTFKEDLESGSKAAVRGGYTQVNLMANTNPICSDMDTFNYVMEKGRKLNITDINQIVSATKDMSGQSIDHLENLTEEVKFISDDGVGVNSDKIMYDVMMKANEKKLTLISHAETLTFSNIDMRLAENMMTFRDIALCEHTKAKVHMAHVSTKECIDAIISAKKRGANLTCEVTPHHLALANSSYRVNPPIREESDLNSLIEAIQNGYVDCIATDHAPHRKEDKEKGAPGISGIETSFSLCYTKLVRGGHISLNKLSELMSKNPSNIMKLKSGEIKPGLKANLVLIDIDRKYIIDSKEFYSKGKNTPFDGVEVYGDVLMTIKDGEIKYIK